MTYLIRVIRRTEGGISWESDPKHSANVNEEYGIKKCRTDPPHQSGRMGLPRCAKEESRIQRDTERTPSHRDPESYDAEEARHPLRHPALVPATAETYRGLSSGSNVLSGSCSGIRGQLSSSVLKARKAW